MLWIRKSVGRRVAGFYRHPCWSRSEMLSFLLLVSRRHPSAWVSAGHPLGWGSHSSAELRTGTLDVQLASRLLVDLYRTGSLQKSILVGGRSAMVEFEILWMHCSRLHCLLVCIRILLWDASLFFNLESSWSHGRRWLWAPLAAGTFGILSYCTDIQLSMQTSWVFKFFMDVVVCEATRFRCTFRNKRFITASRINLFFLYKKNQPVHPTLPPNVSYAIYQIVK